MMLANALALGAVSRSGGAPAWLTDLDPDAVWGIETTEGGRRYRADLSCIRASAGLAQDQAGNWQAFGNNEPRLTDLGLLIEPARTNAIRNNSVMTPDPKLPTNWQEFMGSGVSSTVVGSSTRHGVPGLSVRFSGTSSGMSGVNFRPENNTTIAAANGQTWTTSQFVELDAGSVANINDLRMAIGELPSGTTQYQDLKSLLAAGGGRISLTRTLNQSGTNYLRDVLMDLSFNASAAIDITLWFGAPQCEQGGYASSPILTAGSAATRAADANSLALPSGTFDATVIFDDDSTQTITSVTDGWTLPTNLNRRVVKATYGVPA